MNALGPGWRAAAALGFALALFGGWEWLGIALNLPVWMLPRPSAIALALHAQFASLMGAFWETLKITSIAFAAALASGLGFAIVFTRLRIVEAMFYPWLVTLQVTPVVAIAPLILIWVGLEEPQRALVIIAWIIAFFPIVTNSIQGLRSTPPALRDLFRLYRANGWQTLWHLQLPSALAQILSGARIAAGLALIGAIVAEFVAGTGASQGLGWRIIEAGNRLQTDILFAALFLLALLGVSLFYALTALEWVLLRRWHPKYK